MEKILIATRNKDKFRIASKLLSEIFKNYEFESLKDLEIEIRDKEEAGDIINRAEEKALNVYEQLTVNNYSYIVGIDDNIKMKGKIILDIREYINDIMFNDYLKTDEIVHILRAYSFINRKGEKKSILTEIPFSYQPLKYEFNMEENSYPLSHVLAPLNDNIAVINMHENDSNSYYLEHSINEFNEVKEFFEGVLL